MQAGAGRPDAEPLKRPSRRQVVAALVGPVLAGSGHAQSRPARIGLVAAGHPESNNPNLRAFQEGLLHQGLQEGRHYQMEVRWARSDAAAIPALTAELAGLPVDLILASNNSNVAAARQVTGTIPVVMVLGVDPVRAGFIESFARPGHNVTGLTSVTGAEIDGKMFTLLKELLPGVGNVGVLMQLGTRDDVESIGETARGLGIRLIPPNPVRQTEDLDGVFHALQRDGAQAVYVVGGALIYALRRRVAELSLRHKLPGLHFSADYVRAGGLFSYGIDLRAQYARAGWYVSRILQGARPADMPVEQPARFESAINLQTARALGIGVSRRVMLQVTEVVE